MRALLATLILVTGCHLTNTAEETRHFPRAPLDVWVAAHDVAKTQPRWKEIEACPARGTLVYECSSSLLGFVDDFKVTVDPTTQGTLVHLDSRSRVGKSDWGVNAKRIARFLDDVSVELARRPEATTPATGVAGVGSQTH